MSSQGKETAADFDRLPYTIDPYGYVRRKTRTVMVGDVAIGSDNPIHVQSILTSNVLDMQATVAEIIELVNLGCEIIRINLPTQKHAEQLKNIRAELEAKEIRVSLIGEVEFNPGIMLEEGYGANDPRLKLAQLSEALLRNSRYVASVMMHTQGMTLEAATRFIMDNAYMEETPAASEARRGTFDPGYLNYTLGKLLLLKLREDYKAEQGAAFNLKEFHDRVLAYGAPPLPLLRKVMLQHDNGEIL